jgi:acetyltransferase-like isoleucine patch superfamily enzyme
MSYILTKIRTLWMILTYPFGELGRKTSIDYTCDIKRICARRIKIGSSVYLAPGVWLNVPEPAPNNPAAIIIGDGCKIGRRCMITAKNCVELKEDVLLGPAVVIADHGHEFAGVDRPIHAQGLTPGGTVRIERNCWLGYGAAIVCTSGQLIIGRNSVVGANSVVSRSVPPYSVVAGNPARIVRQFDEKSGKWERVPA